MPAPKKKVVKPVEPVLVLEPECACYFPETRTGEEKGSEARARARARARASFGYG